MFTLNLNVDIQQETFLPDEEFCDFEEATFTEGVSRNGESILRKEMMPNDNY